MSISYPSPATATPGTSTVTFPVTQPLETVSAPQTVTIANEGGNPLQISGATFAGSIPAVATDHPEDFLIGSSSCLGPVVFEASCQLTVRFAPQGEGTRTATLQISSNSGSGTTVVALTGSGGPPQGAGSTGPTGATGSPGPAGATGAQGLTGVTGSLGTTGAAGARGTAGPRGKRGPQGLTAIYTCHRRRLHGKYEKACFVRVLSASSSALSARLTRNGIVYAHGAAGGHFGNGIVLEASRRVPSGRYKLILVSKSMTTERTIVVG